MIRSDDGKWQLLDSTLAPILAGPPSLLRLPQAKHPITLRRKVGHRAQGGWTRVDRG